MHGYTRGNPLKYTDPLGLQEEDSEDSLIEFIKKLCENLGIDPTEELMKEFYKRFAEMAKKSFLKGLLQDDARFIIGLMAFLEAVVEVFGDETGITGAVICIEGIFVRGLGVQGGICFVYHPDLGWAMFLYAGYMWGAMKSEGATIYAGFWTWHGDPDDFEFGDWEEWFFSLEATGAKGIGGGFADFANETSPPTITGWIVGMGVGSPGLGVAAARAYFLKAPNWMIPYYLVGIIAPKPT